MKPKALACILLLFFTFPSLCSSAVRRLCAVSSYLADSGWQEEHVREIVFLTGYEINDVAAENLGILHMPTVDWAKVVKFFYDKPGAEKSPYNLNSNFICIWLSRDDVAILEFPFNGQIRDNKFSPENFRSLFANQKSIEVQQINFPTIKKWRIRAKELDNPFRFIDKR